MIRYFFDNLVKNFQLKKSKELVFSIIIGILAGLFNGLFGGGGGMILVPLLIYLLKYQPKQAHATSILIILPFCIISGLFYIAFIDFNFNFYFPTLIGCFIGGFLGSILLNKIKNKYVTYIFSFIMFLAGLKMLIF